MSKESREVRPYKGVSSFQGALEAVRVTAGADRLEPGGRATLSGKDFQAVPVRIEFGEDEAQAAELISSLGKACAEADLTAHQVDLVVLAATRRLKRREIMFQRTLSELEPAEFAVMLASQSDRPIALQAPVGGCQVHVFLVLNQPLPRKPLRPSRKGTWLARCDFVLATDRTEVGFVPSELTDEVRRVYGLGADATRLVLCESPLDPASGLEDLAVYVDTQVLAELAANPRSAPSRLYQIELFLHAMHVVLMQAASELSDGLTRSLEDIDGSIVHKVIERACRDSAAPEAEMQTMFRYVSTKPSMAIAKLEESVGDLRKAALDSLKAGQK